MAALLLNFGEGGILRRKEEKMNCDYNGHLRPVYNVGVGQWPIIVLKLFLSLIVKGKGNSINPRLSASGPENKLVLR